MIPFTITPSSINILLDNRMRTINVTHPNYKAVRKALHDKAKYKFSDEAVIATLRDLVDIPSFIARVSEGRVKVSDDAVVLDGKPVSGVICERILMALKEGFDVRPMCRFLDRLSNNPLESARNELFLFLESGNMPITEDGYFIAFKKVEHDYASSHLLPNGDKLYNIPGTIVAMPREECDTDRSSTCSVGLHFCSYGYLPHFGVGGESRVVIVKIDPADVVAIPHDYDNTKGRAWRYEVIGEVPEDEARQFFTGNSVVKDDGSFIDSDADGLDNYYENYDDYDSWGCDEDEDDEDEADSPDWGDDEPDSDEDPVVEDHHDAAASRYSPELREAFSDAPDDVMDALLDVLVLSMVIGAPLPKDVPAVVIEAVKTRVQALSAARAVINAHLAAEAEDTSKTKTKSKSKTSEDTTLSLDDEAGPFMHNDRWFTASFIEDEVGNLGQRGFSNVYGVPRTTLQSWLKKIKAAQ